MTLLLWLWFIVGEANCFHRHQPARCPCLSPCKDMDPVHVPLSRQGTASLPGFFPATFFCGNVGINVVTDLEKGCSVTVNVVDDVSPDLICADTKVILNSNGLGKSARNKTSSFDACGLSFIQLDQENFSCVDVGRQVTVTMTGQDNNGNWGQCQANVTVVDASPPTISCIDMVTATLPEVISNMSLMAVARASMAVADNCGVESLEWTVSPATVSCADIGRNIAAVATVTDHGSNSAFCSFKVEQAPFFRVLP